jgi:rSAM/selenodomain-associated transferase 2
MDEKRLTTITHCTNTGFVTDREQNSISVIVPVLNEEKILHLTIPRLYTLQDKAELVFVDGGSSDRTVECVSRLGTVLKSERGRSLQMNTGARMACGNIFLFLHADCYLGNGSLSSMRQCIEHGAVGGCFTQRITNENPAFRAIEREGNRRARMKNVFFGDQGIFVRRDVFRKTGGFPDVPIMEDVLFSKKLAHMGKTVCLNERIYVSSRRWDEHGFHRTNARYKLMWLLYHLRVPARAIQYFYTDGN